MKKIIFTILLTALSTSLSTAQETTVWIPGSKGDAKISKQKNETKVYEITVDEDEHFERLSQIEIASGDERFDRIFREGRELMDKEEWTKAVAKFNEIVCDCPGKKQVDAALYWLAYCYKKQGMYGDANRTISRLIKNFPNSNWAADARVMEVEVARYSPAAVASGGGAVWTTTVPSPPQLLPGEFGFGLVPAKIPLEREDEIKLAAFQSLLSSDTKRALEVLGSDILRSDSKAGEVLKREMIRSLRVIRVYTVNGQYTFSPLTTATSTIVNTGQQNSAVVNTERQQNSATLNAERQQNLNLMRETLMKGFQTEPSVKIRSEIIYSIAGINDDQAFNYLNQLYNAEAEKELKKAIIISLGNPSFYTGFASGAGQSVYVGAVSHNKKPQFEKLMEILRKENDIELRRLAFSSIQRFADWSGREGMVEILSQHYDSESDEQLKSSIITSFGSLKNEKAIKKLLDIARNDKSDQMRLLAIKSLRNHKTPEVLKFLEELIK